MDERTFKTLEVEALLGLLARHVQSPVGRSRVLELAPSRDAREINRALDTTTECVEYLASGEQFGLSGITDPEPALAQLQIEGTSLEPLQILALERLIAIGMDVRRLFDDAELRRRYPQLASITARIPDLRRLLAGIAGKILPGGEIDDNASPDLRDLRREISRTRDRIHRALESIMRGETRAVQEELVTFRNGRFVIPIRTDARGQIPGVVHSLSSSGQTTYVEPLAVIEVNNDLVRLREQEEIEKARILFSITEALRADLLSIRAILKALAEIDFAQAKARLAAEFNCVRPQMVDCQRLKLHSARHILLESMLRAMNAQVVPISLELDESHRVMIISGPNAGGKTVVLKTVGLIALMAQMGLQVPANEAVLPVFDQVLADIGDQQSIATNLSTFTAHMRNISEMIRSAAAPALVLIDEVGTGTDPDEGAALAVAILDHFRQAGVTTVATTHYNPLKMWASNVEGVVNASVEFDEQTLQPTYRLIFGLAGSSSGLEIARRMNVPSRILDAARDLVDPTHAQSSAYLKRLKSLVDEQESLRAALEEERRATAEKYQQLDLQFARRESQRREEFKREFERVIDEFKAESDRLISSLKDRAAAARLKKAAGAHSAQLRRSATIRSEKLAPGAAGDDAQLTALDAPEGEIREGERVAVKTLNQEGVVEDIAGETYTVRIGSLRFRAKRDELRRRAISETPRGDRAISVPGVDVLRDTGEDFSSELKILGMTAEEAIARVDKFLDQAYLSGAENVRIIHGHGKGVLRRVVAELLTDHPQVENFELAPPDQGGAGATVVTMRK